MKDISCWGDSLTAGAGPAQRLTFAAYPHQLQLMYGLGRRVHHRGIAGQTSEQILKRFEAEPQRHADTAVIWIGRNNSSRPAEVVRDLADMTKQMTHGRFLVLTIVNSTTEPAGSDPYEVQMHVNRHIADAYANHAFDIRSKLVEASGGTGDALAADWTLDGLHLSRRAMTFVARQVKVELDRRVW